MELWIEALIKIYSLVKSKNKNTVGGNTRTGFKKSVCFSFYDGEGFNLIGETETKKGQ